MYTRVIELKIIHWVVLLTMLHCQAYNFSIIDRSPFSLKQFGNTWKKQNIVQREKVQERPNSFFALGIFCRSATTG